MDTITYASYGAFRAIIAQNEQIVPISEPQFRPLDLPYINAVSWAEPSNIFSDENNKTEKEGAQNLWW